jgi:hypothetical protein
LNTRKLPLATGSGRADDWSFNPPTVSGGSGRRFTADRA